jgi:hypothetical protein
LLRDGVLNEAQRALLDAVGVAAIDQLKAAHNDAHNLLLRTAAAMGREARGAGFTPRALAWQIAVARAVCDRVTMTCLCRPPMGTARVVITSLTHGARGCGGCIATGLEWPPATDDGRCDVCDRQAKWFREFVTQIGGEYVAGYICDSCSRFSRRAVETAA